MTVEARSKFWISLIDKCMGYFFYFLYICPAFYMCVQLTPRAMHILDARVNAHKSNVELLHYLMEYIIHWIKGILYRHNLLYPMWFYKIQGFLPLKLISIIQFLKVCLFINILCIYINVHWISLSMCACFYIWIWYYLWAYL